MPLHTVAPSLIVSRSAPQLLQDFAHPAADIRRWTRVSHGFLRKAWRLETVSHRSLVQNRSYFRNNGLRRLTQ